MAKNKYIQFGEHGARVFVGEKPPGDSVLVKAGDLDAVRGVPPEFWKLVNGRIVPEMNPVKVQKIHTETKKDAEQKIEKVLSKRGLQPNYMMLRETVMISAGVSLFVGLLFRILGL